MRIYSGRRELVNERGEADALGDTHVTVDGRPLPLRLEVVNHSPTGFEWQREHADQVRRGQS